MTTAANQIEPCRRPKTFVWVAGPALFVTAGLAVFFWFDPARSAFFPTCLFHRLTGLNCPGCGAQRALHELLHGNFLAAARDNASLILWLPILAGLAVRLFIRRARGEPTTLTVRPVWIWFCIGATVVFGVLRNLPGFTWLSP